MATLNSDAALRRLIIGLVAALVAALLAAAPAAAQTGVFDDVVDDAYYSVPVAALAEDGVFVGTECGDGGFCPSESLDRQTMAVWTVRVLDGADSAAVSATRFADVIGGVHLKHDPVEFQSLGVGRPVGCGTAWTPASGRLRRYDDSRAVRAPGGAESPRGGQGPAPEDERANGRSISGRR